jgi:hypothetical protein
MRGIGGLISALNTATPFPRIPPTLSHYVHTSSARPAALNCTFVGRSSNHRRLVLASPRTLFTLSCRSQRLVFTLILRRRKEAGVVLFGLLLSPLYTSLLFTAAGIRPHQLRTSFWGRGW